MRHFVEKREPDRQPIDVKKLIDEALEVTLLGNGRCRWSEVVRGRSRENLPPLEADPVQIQIKILNQPDPSDEPHRSGAPSRRTSWIRIALRAGDGRLQVEVEVEDSGPGIPMETVAQSVQGLLDIEEGPDWGLGLAISRSIAQNHGGDLLVEPGGAGRGATFVLSLPLGVTTTVEREMTRPG